LTGLENREKWKRKKNQIAERNKEWEMTKRILPFAILLMLFVAACSKPPVERAVFEQTQQETLAAEQDAADLKAERDDLQQEFNQKQAELNALQDYQNQLNAEGQ